jgi:DNA helicase-2/ATP-dependent DNA helicase PcrA
MYVGMTRAKAELYLTYAISRTLFGGRVSNPPSRFLSDINAQVGATDVSEIGLTAATEGEHRVPELNQGDAIKHDLFGEGTVVEIEGETATILFKGGSSKRLNIAFAPIVKLE